MEAILLAAGLGTRLRPLTNDKPKALVEVNGRTLLEINIERLAAAGVSRIAVNVHHFGDKMMEYLQSHQWPAEVVISDERTMLLDTGAGLKQAASLLKLNGSVLVHNVDILSHIDLAALVYRHEHATALATLAVSRRETKRQLLFDDEGQLSGWHNRETDEYLWVNEQPRQTQTEYAFSGIAVVGKELLQALPPANNPYAIIPEYLKLAKTKQISHFVHSAEDWLDVGSPARLASAESFLTRKAQFTTTQPNK